MHSNPIHLLSNVFIFGGFAILFFAWRVLYRAQREGKPAKTGIYSRIRHPQYVAFTLVMFGFLLQWPTLLTLLMFPVLVWMYLRLAKREEAIVAKEFGEEYRKYAKAVPAFIPRIGG